MRERERELTMERDVQVRERWSEMYEGLVMDMWERGMWTQEEK